MIRLHQHVRVLHDGFPLQRVARARERLVDVHVVAVEPAGPLDPALVVEADDVDDERVAFPLADRVAVPRRVLRLDRVVRTAVDRDHAERVAILVHEDQLGRGLDDPLEALPSEFQPQTASVFRVVHKDIEGDEGDGVFGCHQRAIL